MKKKIIIAATMVIALAVGGYAAYRFGVNFLFDKYLLGSALSSMADSGEEGESSQEQVIPPLISEETEETAGNVFEQQKEAAEKAKKRLSNTEIITRVLRSSELTYKMASMVPYEDKKRVIQIILSNFTSDELAEIVKTVSKGITSEYKSKMIAEASSRLTSAQWNECLGIAYKYIEKIRPYVE